MATLIDAPPLAAPTMTPHEAARILRTEVFTDERAKHLQERATKLMKAMRLWTALQQTSGSTRIADLRYARAVSEASDDLLWASHEISRNPTKDLGEAIDAFYVLFAPAFRPTMH